MPIQSPHVLMIWRGQVYKDINLKAIDAPKKIDNMVMSAMKIGVSRETVIKIRQEIESNIEIGNLDKAYQEFEELATFE